MSQVPGLTTPTLVVLIGPSGAGKSMWAASHYRAAEIVSSDALRSVVGTGPDDLDATSSAFAVLDQIVTARTARRLTTVIDTLGLDPKRRRRYLEVARAAGLPAAAVLFDTPASLCRTRNSSRERPVPAAALTSQLRRAREVRTQLDDEGWDELVVVRETAPPVEPARNPTPATNTITGSDPPPLDFVLQLSRFPWGEDPVGWLTSIATAAADAGFRGVALMDHLIQIPQVGRAWEPIPEPWVTLGLLAGLDLGLRIGTLVSPITFRSAGLIAKALATLDVLSGGRAFCGLGAGWWEREHQGFGLPFAPAGERLDQLEIAIETMRALWAPGTRPYSGRGVILPETTCYPRPLGRIPVVVGGSGSRTLRIAAGHADACNVPSDPDVVAAKVELLRRHCADVGRDPAQVGVTVLDLPIIGVDRDAVASRIERVRGRSSAANLALRAGTCGDHVARYRRLVALGVSTVFVSPAELRGPEDLSDFIPVIRAFT